MDASLSQPSLPLPSVALHLAGHPAPVSILGGQVPGVVEADLQQLVASGAPLWLTLAGQRHAVEAVEWVQRQCFSEVPFLMVGVRLTAPVALPEAEVTAILSA